MSVTDKRKRSETSSTSSLSDWDKSLDTIVEEINKVNKKHKNKKHKTQKTENSPTEIKKSEKEPKIMSEKKEKSIDKKLDAMSKQLSKMITKDDKSIFREIIKETFQEMKDQLLESFNKRLEILEGDLHVRAIENNELKTEVDNMKQEIKKKDDELKSMINKKHDEIKEAKLNIKTEADEIKGDLNDLEQYGRRNNIRIVGLRNDKPFETSQDTAWQVVNFINDKMDINISVHQIDIAHRLGPYSRDTNRNIIVRLISRQVKFNVLTHCKELKNTGVYINEDLTHTNQKVLSSMRLKDPKTVERAC